MVRAFVIGLLVICGAFLAGCQTTTRNEEQQIRKYSRIADINRRMFAEDMDAIFLLDRPSDLTHWHFYVD